MQKKPSDWQGQMLTLKLSQCSTLQGVVLLLRILERRDFKFSCVYAEGITAVSWCFSAMKIFPWSSKQPSLEGYSPQCKRCLINAKMHRTRQRSHLVCGTVQAWAWVTNANETYQAHIEVLRLVQMQQEYIPNFWLRSVDSF